MARAGQGDASGGGPRNPGRSDRGTASSERAWAGRVGLGGEGSGLRPRPLCSRVWVGRGWGEGHRMRGPLRSVSPGSRGSKRRGTTEATQPALGRQAGGPQVSPLCLDVLAPCNCHCSLFPFTPILPLTCLPPLLSTQGGGHCNTHTHPRGPGMWPLLRLPLKSGPGDLGAAPRACVNQTPWGSQARRPVNHH